MTQSRIEVFCELLKSQPDDVMIWYGLASEYTKLADWALAIEALNNVIRINPSYTAAYQMLGSALMSQGQVKEACDIWRQGIEVANQTGAWKAKQHMEGLLAANSSTNSGFCSH
ncbi:MAG: tetratricopeptide repeat protein [Acidobacteria bacterium]|nr:tetratricopeptide repeat protein [Acidobacteriota bacterium]